MIAMDKSESVELDRLIDKQYREKITNQKLNSFKSSKKKVGKGSLSVIGSNLPSPKVGSEIVSFRGHFT